MSTFRDAPLVPAPDGLDRDNILFMARTAEKLKRYDDMMVYTKHLVKTWPTLTQAETTLVVSSYRRASATIRCVFCAF
jgi:hypothetical protein